MSWADDANQRELAQSSGSREREPDWKRPPVTTSPDTDKKVFRTYDEEYNPSERIGQAVTDYLDGLELDTVNEEYAVIVEVVKL